MLSVKIVWRWMTTTLVIAGLGLVMTACSGSDDPAPVAATKAESTSTTIDVARARWCRSASLLAKAISTFDERSEAFEDLVAGYRRADVSLSEVDEAKAAFDASVEPMVEAKDDLWTTSAPNAIFDEWQTIRYSDPETLVASDLAEFEEAEETVNAYLLASTRSGFSAPLGHRGEGGCEGVGMVGAGRRVGAARDGRGSAVDESATIGTGRHRAGVSPQASSADERGSTPNVARSEQDPCRAALYDAEEAWTLECCGLATEPAPLANSAVRVFLGSALASAGYRSARIPEVDFDVADDAGWSGWHDGRTRRLHLHPLLLDPPTLLHELSHWVDDRDGHGPIFQANMVELVLAAMGPDAARALWGSYRSYGLEPDPGRMAHVTDALTHQES